ncbi:MAG TPA: tyrosine-type recombinase/integrase [Myxococcales bacterium]
MLKGYFRWLAKNGHVLLNPAAELELPKAEKKLPSVLTLTEVESVLALPDVSTPAGLRDRTLMEVFWTTAIRRTELARLTIYSVDHERATLLVRNGKGRKDRVVPFGERALAWLTKYLADARPLLVVEPDAGILFLRQDGQAFVPTHLSLVVHRYIQAAGIEKTGGCHVLRHSAATAMLEGGADIRAIQELLGHASLASTQLYTQVSIRRLQEVHARTHPGAKLERKSERTPPTEPPSGPPAPTKP